MLKRLQRKFVAIAILALFTVVFVELFSVNVVNVYQRDSDSKSLLYLIAQNDGVLPNTARDDSFGARRKQRRPHGDSAGHP